MATPLNVLLLEDSLSDADLIVYELRRAGFAPNWRRVQTEADYLAMLDPALDLILADYALPQFDALRALDLLRARNLRIPFIIISGAIGEDIAVTAVKKGAADYLLKDRLARLGSAVRRTLEQQQLQNEMRRAEEELQAKARLNQAVLSSLRARIVVLDAGGTIIAINDAWARFAQANGDPLLKATGIGVNYLTVCQRSIDFSDDRSAAITLAGLQAVLRREQPQFSQEYDCLTLEGLRWFRLHGLPLSDMSGVVIAHEDVTERREAEQALRDHAARLQVLASAARAFAEAGTDYQAVLDRVARVTAELLGDTCSIRLLSADGERLEMKAIYDIDPTALEVMQLTWGSLSLRVDDLPLRGKAFFSGQPILIPVVDIAPMRAAMPPASWPIMDRLAVHSMIIAPMHMQGRVIGLLYLSRHRQAQPAFSEHDLRLAQDLADRAALAMTNARLFEQVQRELAERAKVEEALRLLNIQLEERVAERTAELSQANASLRELSAVKDMLLAITSHDLRSPLGAIQTMADMLLDGPDLSDRGQRLARNISSSARHLIAIVRNMLDLSKLEAGKVVLEPVTLQTSSVARESLEALAASIEAKAITAELIVLPGEPHVRADWMKLSQIIDNLLSNALKFTAPGGQIVVTVGPESSGVAVEVADTGLGIPAAELAHLFEPFRQQHLRGTAGEHGSGLGLAIVQQLIDLHGGSIMVRSEVGRGSTFSFYLPTQAAMPQAG
jgi:signal transduction histidine kinase/DNA-binding NarL/FixJ family response regulator